VLASSTFASFFTSCGAASTTIVAQTDACAAICLDLAGDTTGSAQLSFSAIDDAGRPLVFATPRTTLLAK
jgi:hypothetical protein